MLGGEFGHEIATRDRRDQRDLVAIVQGVLTIGIGAVERERERGRFVATEADATAIRAIYEQEGELSAAIELRRRFRGITDNAKARVRWSIAGVEAAFAGAGERRPDVIRDPRLPGGFRSRRRSR